MYLDFSGYSLYGHGNIHDTKARYSKPRIKEPQDFSCPKTLKVVSVTFHTPLDLTIHDSQGMYDPGAEHDACGVGMVTTLNKRPERKIVDDAIEVLVNELTKIDVPAAANEPAVPAAIINASNAADGPCTIGRRTNFVA